MFIGYKDYLQVVSKNLKLDISHFCFEMTQLTQRTCRSMLLSFETNHYQTIMFVYKRNIWYRETRQKHVMHYNEMLQENTMFLVYVYCMMGFVYKHIAIENVLCLKLKKLKATKKLLCCAAALNKRFICHINKKIAA